MSFRYVFLTGAGISRESGIATFRDADGIWAKVRVEDVATPQAFARDPARVQGFYNARRRQLLSGEVQPNAAHIALAQFEAAHPGEVLVVTQNIDDLHERGGQSTVWHIHGELLKSRCTDCEAVRPCRADLEPGLACPDCGRRGTLRPHVVWFGEIPLLMDEITEAVAACDVFVAIGTSGNVYPAAGLVQMATAGGAETAELNLAPSENAARFTSRLYGPATEVVPKFLARLG